MSFQRLTKKEINDKKQIAYIMYMAFTDNKVIAENLGVAAKTIGEWAEAGHWKTKRTAGTITRDELVNKALQNLNSMFDKALQEGGEVSPDDLAKMSKVIETLDKKNNIVYNTETFMSFNKYLLMRMQTDKNLLPEIVKVINKLQNDFITEKMSAQ